MDIARYIELKNAGSDRIELSLEGDQVLVRQKLYDTISGNLKSEAALVPINQIEAQAAQLQKKIDEMTANLNQFKAILADIKELQKK